MDGLIDLLIRLYEDPGEIRLLLKRIGFDTSLVNFNAPSRTIWDNVLDEVSRNLLLDELAEAVTNDFEERRAEIVEALQSFLRMRLIVLMADLYASEENAWAAVGRAGVAADQIEHKGDMVSFWRTVLEQAATNGKVSRIVQVAIKKFPERSNELARAEQEYIKGRSEIELQPVAPPARIRVVNTPPFVAPAYFQDRHTETKVVNSFLEDDAKRLLVVVGRGGLGKTSMVCRALRELEGGALPDGGRPLEAAGIVYLSTIGSKRVNFEGLFKSLCRFLPDEKVRDLGILFGNSMINARIKMQALLAELARGRIIVLLDNLESLIDIETFAIKDIELDEAIRAALEAEQHAVKLIMTTRVPPGPLMQVAAGRQSTIYLDEGLASPYAENALREMDEDGTLGLRTAPAELLDRARQITRGYPKALEALFAILAADRATSLEDILEETMTALVDQIVMVLVGEAFNRLDGRAQRVMQALAIYGRPVIAAAVNYLLHAFLQGSDATPVLHRLVSLQMARKEGKLYYLHPMDRSYALSLVPKGQDWDRQEVGTSKFTQIALLHRAADYLKNDRKPRESLQKGEDIEPQLAEFDLRCEGGEYDVAARVLIGIDIAFLSLWGMNDVVVRMYQRLMGKLADRTLDAPCRISDPQLLRRSLFGLGTARFYLGQYEDAIDSFSKSVQLAREAEDRIDEGLGLGYIGSCYYYLGRVAESIATEEGVLQIASGMEAQASETTRLLLIAHGRLGICLDLSGETQRALESIEEALKAARSIDDSREESFYLDLLGLLNGYLGDFEKANSMLDQALEIAEKSGDWYGVSMHYCNLMETWNNQGRFEKVIALSEKLKARYRNLNPAVASWGNVELAVAQLAVGQFAAARAAVEDARRVSVPQNNYMTHAVLGLVAFRQGRPDEARLAFEVACKEADALLHWFGKNVSAIDTKGLALTGLSLCDGRDDSPEGVMVYGEARSISRVPGHVRRAVLLLEMLLGNGDAMKYQAVRSAAAGEEITEAAATPSAD